MSEYKKLSDGVFTRLPLRPEIGVVSIVRVSVIERVEIPLDSFLLPAIHHHYQYSYEILHPGQTPSSDSKTARSTLLMPGQHAIVLDENGKKLIIENRNGEAILKKKQSWFSLLFKGEQPARRVPISS